jgi:hypothetical protein
MEFSAENKPCFRYKDVTTEYPWIGPSTRLQNHGCNESAGATAHDGMDI